MSLQHDIIGHVQDISVCKDMWTVKKEKLKKWNFVNWSSTEVSGIALMEKQVQCCPALMSEKRWVQAGWLED